MHIRAAAFSDAAAIAAVEAACFPPAEAAGLSDFEARLRVYPRFFWLLEDSDRLVGFIDGMVTDEPTIRDEMFENAALHRENGSWQAIFGVAVLPEYRRRGCAARIMRQAISDAKAQGRKGCILTCKETLAPYYETFGYRNEGISRSVHGGAVWYDMRLTF